MGAHEALASDVDSKARLRALYSIMQSRENLLGGGEGVEGLYGSINCSGMQRVLDCLREKCGLDSSSVLVDIGAGLGRPLMHALVEPGVAGARGVELDRVKCDKAAAFLQQTVRELAKRGLARPGLAAPEVECSSIEQVRTLDPATHAYSFWEGVPLDGKVAFGRLFAASRSLRAVAVVQRAVRRGEPAEMMQELGFGRLVLAASFAVSMSGSGRSFTAYVFNREEPLPPPLPCPLGVEQAPAASVDTPACDDEPAPAATAAAADESCTAAAAAAASCAEVDSTLPGPAAAAVEQPLPLGRGRRQVRAPAKLQQATGGAAATSQQQQKQQTARQQRAARRSQQQQQLDDLSPAASGPLPSADACTQSQETAAPAPATAAPAPALPPAAGVAPVPAAAAAKPKAAGSSPPKGGVQKKVPSPAKAARALFGPHLAGLRRQKLASALNAGEAGAAAASATAKAKQGASVGRQGARRGLAAGPVEQQAR